MTIVAEVCQSPLVTVVLAALNVYQAIKLKQIESRPHRTRSTDRRG